jgi:hypothetical protein
MKVETNQVNILFSILKVPQLMLYAFFVAFIQEACVTHSERRRPHSTKLNIFNEGTTF